jgi:hypothetical protein
MKFSGYATNYLHSVPTNQALVAPFLMTGPLEAKDELGRPSDPERGFIKNQQNYTLFSSNKKIDSVELSSARSESLYAIRRIDYF